MIQAGFGILAAVSVVATPDFPPSGPVMPAQLQVEDQTPTGKFTTAGEVRQILEMTKGNWIGVREWEGQDLLYVTHLWSWRCGMAQMRVGVNDGPLEVWALPPCHMDLGSPNAIIDSDGLPYRAFPLSTVQTIRVELLLDDLTTLEATFTRDAVRIP